MTRKNELRDAFIANALNAAGYRARPNLDSAYGRATGHPNAPWDGSYIEAIARESNVQLPNHVSTVSALQEFTRLNRLYSKPRPGDIAFFAFSTNGPHGQPHVGIVTETGEHGSFYAVEAQVSSGLPYGNQEATAVFRRQRHATDVITFARPTFKPRKLAAETKEGLVWLRASNFQYGKPTERVALLQMALAEVTGLRNAKRGMFDSQTRSAYATFERQIGVLDGTGQPTTRTLQALADQTGLFTVRP